MLRIAQNITYLNIYVRELVMLHCKTSREAFRAADTAYNTGAYRYLKE